MSKSKKFLLKVYVSDNGKMLVPYCDCECGGKIENPSCECDKCGKDYKIIFGRELKGGEKDGILS